MFGGKKSDKKAVRKPNKSNPNVTQTSLTNATFAVLLGRVHRAGSGALGLVLFSGGRQGSQPISLEELPVVGLLRHVWSVLHGTLF